MKNKVISILLVAMIIMLGAMSISFAKDSLDGVLIAAKTLSSSSSNKGSTTKKCNHVFSGGNCISKSKCVKCGARGDFGDHSWSSWSTKSSATCENAGKQTRTCKYCSNTESRSISPLGHNYGDWEPTYKDRHARYCSRCGNEETQAHDSAYKLNIGDKTIHETYCKTCWDSGHQRINKGTENHTWSGGENSPHKCSGQPCGYVRTPSDGMPYHYYGINTGETISTTAYSCQLSGCGNSITLSTDGSIGGLDVGEYACSDAEVQMPNPPTFSSGVYTAAFSGQIRDQSGKEVTGLKVPDEWITLYGWTQRNIESHRKANSEYKREYEKFVDALYGQDLSYEDLHTNKAGEKITWEVNGLAEGKMNSWNPIFGNAGIEAIKNGSIYKATQKYNSGGHQFEFDFYPGSGGWMFEHSLLFKASNGVNGLLFQSGGGYKKEAPIKIYADIYYCYRTLDGKVPKNGYQYLYKHSSEVVYNGGRKTVTVDVTADLDKIDLTGYRYVGSKTSVGQMGKIDVSGFSENARTTNPTAKVTVGFDYRTSAAIVTFFVEPVKLYYGHAAIDYKGRVQDIVAPTLTNTTGLEFPDYYNGTRCVISDIKSLNKFFWPGFILQNAKTYQYAGNSTVSSYNQNDLIFDKYYDADETTVYVPNQSGNRLVVKSSVPSRYIDSDASGTKNSKLYIKEKAGYASDKQFYYYYNTPTLKIEHRDYDSTNLLQDRKNQDLEYLVQILHQYALVTSLITDNIGSDGSTIHNLIVNDLNAGTKSFSYNFGNRDLVQIQIYEIDSSGRESLYGTLYSEDEYKPRDGKSYKVSRYAGVFEKYYTDSLSNIVSQISQTSTTFNTNKNWRIVFNYRPVERVYISFMDLKGNKIFIRDPQNPGKYLPEITSKIDKVNGYSHLVTDLGTDGSYRALGYTEDTQKYIRDYSKAKETSNGTTLTVPGNTGDRYIVIYYSTEKTVLIEYKDTKGNTIKDSTTLEIPDTGTIAEVPVINLYEVVEYKKNENAEDPNSKTEDKPSSPLTKDDKQISVPSTDHNQHIIIYYEAKEALKVEYREKGTEKSLTVPPEYQTTTWIEIPETGIKIEVPVVPGYEVRFYKYNDNYNGTDSTINGPERQIGTAIPVDSNGNNQYVIIYYEKVKETSKLIIEYRENTPDGEELRESSEMDIPVGEETKIIPPDIDGYTPTNWVKPDGSTNDDIENIIVVGEPDGTKKIIIIYKKTSEDPGETPDEPGVITPDDNKQKVILRANTGDTDPEKCKEEYNVDVAIPTSEDLYTKGDVYSYRFVTDIVEAPYTENIKVRISQDYYKNTEDLSKKGTVTTPPLDVQIKYNYYDIKKAELYDLKQMIIINEALKNYNGYDYDTGATGRYEAGRATLGVNKNIPDILYELPEGIGLEADKRIQLKDNAGYKVTKGADGVYNIKLQDIAYVKPNEAEFRAMYEMEADGIVEKCTFIRVQTLKIQMAGTNDVTILTGEQYNLPKKSEALKSVNYYIPYTAGRAPLYSFFHNKDLFVQESALNKNYVTTFEGDYRLIKAVVNNAQPPKKYEPKKIASNPESGRKLGVEKLTINSLNIHTPIVNNVTLTPAKDNTNSTQLASGKIQGNLAKYNNSTILNLDKQFTITIPNAGAHINSIGYGNKNFNVTGTLANDTVGTINGTRLERNNLNLITEDYLNKYGIETEENSYGPTFAEMKLIKFPYDVYLLNTDKGDASRQQKGEPQLFKANEWYNLYDYIKPSVTTYTFVLPVWVKDAHEYKVANGEGVYVLIVAENCPKDKFEAAKANPASVNKNTQNDKNTYILGKTFDTYVSGRVYDIEIRDTDDPGYMSKVPALKCEKLPLAQAGQVKAYKLGLKLGYRFYFDLKTKGIANNAVKLAPKIYYVPATGGNATADISLFYHTKTTLYNKLTEKDLNVNMIMASTHGNVNNTKYTVETVAAKALNTSRIFASSNVIGKLNAGLVLRSGIERLPYDNLTEEMSVCGFSTFGLEKFLASAKQSATINGNEHNIRNAAGHWYGEYYLPASTLVYKGNKDRNAAIAKQDLLPSGYLIVAFEEITTSTDGSGKGYLTYSAPTGNTQWQKENAHQSVVLPNGKNAVVPTAGTPMAIYQVGLRANNDYETEGTH